MSSGTETELVLYHMNGSRSTRAIWLYEELQAIYENLPPMRVHVFDPATFRKDKPEWYLKLNPNGKVPALQHGSTVMFDSSAICLYILQLFDKDRKFAPLDQPEFASLFYQLAFYCSGTIDNLTATSSPIQMVLECKTPGDEEKAVELNHQAWIQQCGPILLSLLGDKKFMFGQDLSAADVVVGVNMHYIHVKRGWHDFPALEAYFERCKERPGYQKAFTAQLTFLAADWSSYFKGLLSITSVDGLAEEIQTSGDSLEVYEKGTSMATPSAFFCAVFRLHNLDHTEEELQMLLDHPDYVIARCVGFLFARFTMRADRLWDVLEEYMLDDMSLGAFRDGSMPNTIGEYIEHLLLKEKYCGTPLPRLPVTARRRLEEHIAPLAQHRKRAAANRRELECLRKPGTAVEIAEEGEWLPGSVLELNASVPSRLKVTVQLQEGNITTVHLGKVILTEEGPESSRRRGGSPDWSRCKGKSESVLLQELRGHAKEEAVCGSGKDYAKRPQAFEVGLAKRREQGSAESQMQQEDTTHARQKRRSDKDADADRESKMLRRSTDEEKERQRYSKQIFEKYGQVRSRPSAGTAQDDDVDRIQLG
ncbi:SRL1 [Symbiodinium sp. KB8]|nr:SRL1 [Symbiodinium sp. KB8]